MSIESSPSSGRNEGDFPAGLGGGEARPREDHRVGETTRQDPRVADVDPAPQRPGAAQDDEADRPSDNDDDI